jgi:hypothetical protein
MTVNGSIPGPVLEFTEGEYYLRKMKWRKKRPSTGTLVLLKFLWWCTVSKYSSH